MPPGVQPAPYLASIRVLAERLPPTSEYPFNLPFVSTLHLQFAAPVTFFAGENGSGKSTLLEAIAALCRLPVSGGSRNEEASTHGPEQESSLRQALRASFFQRPTDGFFLRAEFAAYFASLLDERRADPSFSGNPYSRYGGRSLHVQSHGEAFLAILQNRFQEGIFLLDEQESARSPQRQVELLSLLHDMVAEGRSQFLIATHSPVLMTYPGAQIINFDDSALPVVALQDTAHYRVTRGILEEPGRWWKHLAES